MSLFDYLEDWDDPELSQSEWRELMEEKVREYNSEFGTNHKPVASVYAYESEKRKKSYGDQ